MASTRMLAAVHFVVNALLLWLGYYWLGVGESRAASLAWSALVALLFVCLVCCAYGSVLAFFQMDANRRVIAAWREALRNLLPLALAALVIVAIYVLLARWADYSATPATNVASYLTLKLRKPVKPSTVLRVFNVALWLVRWVVIPVFLLPMLSATAARGWHGFGAAGALARKWLYWIEAPVLLLCAIWVPSKLLGWVPGVDGFSTEMASFVLRAGVAYLFFVTAWLVLAFVTSGGKPRLTQPSTVASP